MHDGRWRRERNIRVVHDDKRQFPLRRAWRRKRPGFLARQPRAGMTNVPVEKGVTSDERREMIEARRGP